MSGLRRAALVFGILSLLLFADAAYLLATHNNVGGDTGTLFGNSHYYLNAGTVVALSATFVLVASVIMWLADVHREDKKRERRPAGDAPTPEQPGLSGRTASHATAGDPPAREQPGPSGRTASRA
jgi:hypothetical protein